MRIKESILKITLFLALYFLTVLVIFFVFSHEPKELRNWQYFRLVLSVLFIPLLAKYVIQLMIVPWYGLINLRETKSYNENFQPKVSVIVPAWNEEVGIIDTIESILDCDYENFELIIVNDGSTDKTDEKINCFCQKYQGNIPIRYFKKENGGKATALNFGLKKAAGEIIITTDADSAIDRHAIKNIVKRFSKKEVMAVAGNVRIGNTRKIIESIQKLEYVYGFYFKRSDSILNSVYIVGGAAAAYRKEIFGKLGYFDQEIITEDIEFSTRILNAGFKISYAPDALFYTEAPSDLNSLVKQRLRWKYGRLKTFLKYRNLFFRIRGGHSIFLSFLILPVAFFAEILLLMEVIFLPLFYTYSFLSGDFVPLLFAIFILSVIIFLQILTDVNKMENKEVFLWVPIAWIIFYFIDFVEYVALTKSIIKLIKKKDVSWQTWKRVGVFSK